MRDYVQVDELRVAGELHDFVRDELAPGTGVDPTTFWHAFARMLEDLEPENRKLLDKRDVLQSKIDNWHLERSGHKLDHDEYRSFLTEIGYLVVEGDDFEVTTANVDPEVASIAGPQLVVPVDNARFALNAANARWGSLYDAIYGSDVIADTGKTAKGTDYNPIRGAEVVTLVEAFLDQHVPLSTGSYADVIEWCLGESDGRAQLLGVLGGGQQTGLANVAQFVGYQMTDGKSMDFLLRHHGLHIEIQVDRDHPVGRAHPAGVKDVLMEAAITTIQDFEDSVSTVDAEDKTRAYRHWLGIMQGTLEATFEKDGRTMTRSLRPDKSYTSPDGPPITLPGRSLLLVRNVGIHMYTDAVTTLDGRPIPEGFLDAMITSLAAIHDLRGRGALRNSRARSIYIVKPKLHGPEEVAATVELFASVEDALGLARNTLKMGIMDEERRTTVNLKECIRQARQRIVFINTGFLDRTGDEIHTSMEAGPMVPKMEIKKSSWMLAYEDWNVDIGIQTGLPGRAQIGKGMWTMPDRMRAMMEEKRSHPLAGASTAWVPSPTAATLHAMHYHQVDVSKIRHELAQRPRASLLDILTPPLLGDRKLNKEDIRQELENNAQGILGYVVRWVQQGIGCSKVPDIHNIGLMEDRATLRISSQHIANWYHHGLIEKDDVRAIFEAMATVVDRQNASDPKYRSMSSNLHGSFGFQAALDLVFEGCREPNGYTEHVLTQRRRQVKTSET